jgi:hypothetical protein
VGATVDGPVALGAGVLDVTGRAGWGLFPLAAAPERWEGMVTPGMTSIGRTSVGAVTALEMGFVAVGFVIGDD